MVSTGRRDPLKSHGEPGSSNVGEIEVPVIPIEDMRKLLNMCKANFDDRRDAAIIRLFYDTGLRLSEMAGLQVGDVDIAGKVLHVTGKGNKGRAARYANRRPPR